MPVSKNVIIAVSAQQHSYKSCKSLIRADMLERYYTTIFYRRGCMFYKILDAVLPPNDLKKMHGRYDKEIEPYTKTFCSFRNLLVMIADRINRTGVLKSVLQKFVEIAFAKKVIADIGKGNELLISYDCYSYALYVQANRTKRNALIRVLDMASIPVDSIIGILLRERNLSPALEREIDKELAKYSENYRKRRAFEIAHADYCLVGCSFAKNEMLKAGFPEDRLCIVPLGVDGGVFHSNRTEYASDGIVRFIFVGRISPAKGIAHLLKAFMAQQDKRCELILVGRQCCPGEYLEPYISTGKVKLAGMLRKDEMPNAYQRADVYVLSSLYEGFSLSLMEAMSSGLPVIASENSIAADIITQGNEGFVYDPFDDVALANYMEWMIDHRDKLSEMGANARETASKYSWTRYSEQFSNAIGKIQLNEDLVKYAR